jgi:LAO/AO transport system kinase
MRRNDGNKFFFKMFPTSRLFLKNRALDLYYLGVPLPSLSAEATHRRSGRVRLSTASTDHAAKMACPLTRNFAAWPVLFVSILHAATSIEILTDEEDHQKRNFRLPSFFPYFAAMSTQELISQIKARNPRALARAISLVENEAGDYAELLTSLQVDKPSPVIGFTGAPGAGKSSLVNPLATSLVAKGKRIAIIAVDPTSPFNYGSLLGDRIRMSGLFNDEHVFIRSMAARGSLGGLCGKIIEVVHLLQAFGFDYIIVETVGVGQSEVEIAGLADTTVVVVVPESGDEVQTLKSGVMEIADIFAVNKSDREGSAQMVNNLKKLVHDKTKSGAWQTPVISTVATSNQGIDELSKAIDLHHERSMDPFKKASLLADKALLLIQQHYVKHLKRRDMEKEIAAILQNGGFNLYEYVRGKLS